MCWRSLFCCFTANSEEEKVSHSPSFSATSPKPDELSPNPLTPAAPIIPIFLGTPAGPAVHTSAFPAASTNSAFPGSLVLPANLVTSTNPTTPAALPKSPALSADSSCCLGMDHTSVLPGAPMEELM